MSIMYDKNKERLFQNHIPLQEDRENEKLLELGTFIALEELTFCTINVLKEEPLITFEVIKKEIPEDFSPQKNGLQVIR